MMEKELSTRYKETQERIWFPKRRCPKEEVISQATGYGCKKRALRPRKVKVTLLKGHVV